MTPPNGTVEATALRLLLTGAQWRRELDAARVFSTPWFEELAARLAAERKHSHIYPPVADTFSAVNLTALLATRVVFVGFDPYQNPGLAHGLAFSVPSNAAIPPSLARLFKVLVKDTPCAQPGNGDLSRWARDEGVLLLNTALSVRHGVSGSHAELWDKFILEVFTLINTKCKDVVFVLLGNEAKGYRELTPAR